jgi:SAM-dependent methyltransferase
MRDDYYLDPRAAEAYDAGPELPVDDIPFYVELAQQAAAAGQSVLELGCGTGRVTIPIAQAGVNVTGLDRSPAMLDVARRKSEGIDNLRWVQGDMTDFALEERFGLTIIPFRSFLLLLTVAEQKACLARIHEHLADGGRLALNVFNPNLALIGEWLSTRRGGLQRISTYQDPQSGHQATAWQSNQYATSEQRLDHTRITEELGDDGAVISRVYRNLRLRYVFRYEMEHLLALSGFEVEGLWGWFDRRPFSDESSEMVWVAQRV